MHGHPQSGTRVGARPPPLGKKSFFTGGFSSMGGGGLFHHGVGFMGDTFLLLPPLTNISVGAHGLWFKMQFKHHTVTCFSRPSHPIWFVLNTAHVLLCRLHHSIARLAVIHYNVLKSPRYIT